MTFYGTYINTTQGVGRGEAYGAHLGLAGAGAAASAAGLGRELAAPPASADIALQSLLGRLGGMLETVARHTSSRLSPFQHWRSLCS